MDNTATKKQRNGGDIVSDLTGLGVEPRPISSTAMSLTTAQTGRFSMQYNDEKKIRKL